MIRRESTVFGLPWFVDSIYVYSTTGFVIISSATIYRHFPVLENDFLFATV